MSDDGEPLDASLDQLHLVRRAIRERWPIPDRDKLMRRLADIVLKSDSDRAVVAAAKAILVADLQNQEQEKRDGGIPDRVDVTSGGKPLERREGLTAEDVLEADRLLALADRRLQPDGAGQPVGPGCPVPPPKAVPRDGRRP